ncbi:Uncharacterized beta-barrel protein YwiB, DUF1934 family [Gracilibacillus ureilyticus]|uniref:Uncharacterized beta-barrel protein YwiB, DUF1934 family n=1 Tax=Gracilibacillus ureilyticus TaxID=531814 RepID=A0A1H9SUG9_9BACI|nr:DUF1934 domain-containing protein [Gracilibacillus ureilyticus]SER88517.1 Uncharacterized beta-barrel protein YwiB, DUF1934 family [Gracilibacillus ureilyticus]
MTEKSPVSIKMTMEINDLGKKDVTIVEEQGQLLEKETTSILTFSESNENEEQIHSFITIKPDSVSVKRSGAVSMLQKFIKKQITENVYRHEFGTIHMETTTDQIIYQPPENQKQGKLFISYSTSLNGDKPRRHSLTIVLKKQP